MNKKFSPEVKKIISVSRDEAIRLGHDYIGTEHLLLGIIQDRSSLACKVLEALDVDFDDLKAYVEDSISKSRKDQANFNVGSLPLDKHAEKVLKVTFLEAKVFKNDEISPEHLMLSILKHTDNLACKIMKKYSVDYETYKNELDYMSDANEHFIEDISASSSSESDLPMEEES